MKVRCEKCGKEFDDFDHWTYCPHAYFPPNGYALKDELTADQSVYNTLHDYEKFE